MGWGCYKHEWDVGSENWKERMDALCDRKLQETPRTFGRDEQVCPACYEELEQKLEEVMDVVRAADRLWIKDGELQGVKGPSLADVASPRYQDLIQALDRCRKAKVL